MSRLVEITHRLASMNELADIVGAMRSLAGMRMREAQQALPGVGSYGEAMTRALGTALSLDQTSGPEPGSLRGHRILVLCGAEHGFVGGFNDRLLSSAEKALQHGDELFVIGARAAAAALERGVALAWSGSMATHAVAAPDSVGRLMSELYRRLARGEVLGLAVMYARARPGKSLEVMHRSLLPIDRAAFPAAVQRSRPLHQLTPRVLIQRFIAEYLFAILTEAAVESIAGENAARLAAMEAARENVDRKLESLREQSRQARQTEITDELLDLITGTEAAEPLTRGTLRTH